jgi:hypothetical protein
LGTITALPSSRPTANGPKVIAVISTCAIDTHRGRACTRFYRINRRNTDEGWLR